MSKTSAFILVALLFELVACGDQSPTTKKPAQNTSSGSEFENSLTFNDITLDQADEQGRPLWKMKAKRAIYSKDKQVAQVQSPSGQLFQDGKVVYIITAAQGEIRQDGKLLFLKGHIVATNPRNGVVMRGNELEWRPGEDLMIVRNQVSATRQQVHAVAQQGRLFSRAHRMELQGGVVATASDSQVQLRTEHVIWQLQEEKIFGDRPVQIDRFKGKVVTDRATANSCEFNLKTKIATLKQNAQLTFVDPPLQVASNSMTWNLNTQTVTADQPVRMVHRQQQLTLTANRGQMDLQKNIVYLTDNVYGIGQRGQSLKANKLTWYLPTKEFEAEGNVDYRQLEPPLISMGQKAVGNLQDQSVVVSGGGVVTEFVP